MTESRSVQLADLRPPPRPTAWLRRHPIVIDVVVVLVACAPHLIALLSRGDLGWWGYPLLAITATALLLRRRWPVTMLAIVAVACALSPLAQPGFGYPMIPFSFALYTVASLQSTTRALIGYGIGIGVTALATIPYSLGGTTPPLVALLDPFSLIALVIGLIVRNRRQQQRRLVELVNQRIENAALAERTRIAAEMHDVVAHSLTVIVALADGATSIRARSPEKADAAVERIADVGRDALADMQRTLGMLRSADPGLDANLHRSGADLPALDELADRFRDAGLPVRLVREGRADPRGRGPAAGGLPHRAGVADQHPPSRHRRHRGAGDGAPRARPDRDRGRRRRTARVPSACPGPRSGRHAAARRRPRRTSAVRAGPLGRMAHPRDAPRPARRSAR